MHNKDKEKEGYETGGRGGRGDELICFVLSFT